MLPCSRTCLWLLGVASLLSIGRAAAAAEIVYLSDGTQPTLAAAIHDAGLTGVPVVLVVPPGDFEIVGDLTIETSTTTGLRGDDLLILGSGPERTRLARSDGNGHPVFLIQNAARVRISGISFSGGDQGAAATAAQVAIRTVNTPNVRIDHCRFEHQGYAGVHTHEHTVGVVDHSRFVDMYKAPNETGYGVIVEGLESDAIEPFGTELATFIEDSLFIGCRHAVASCCGSRYVFRNNHIRGNVVSHAIDAHGDDSGAGKSSQWVDVHDNLVEAPASGGTNAVRLRGGQGLIWSNDLLDYAVGIDLTDTTSATTGPVWAWGNYLPGEDVHAHDGVVVHYDPPADYTPYPYPHPLVADLDVQAGADAVSTQEASVGGGTYLDGSATTASEGTVVAYRWHDGDTVVSTCRRDIVQLSPGVHTLVLEAERSDGLLEYDSAVAEVVAPGAVASAPSWPVRSFVPIVGSGTIELDVTPSAAAMDGYVSFTERGPVFAHTDHAILIRTWTGGVFDAINGTSYAAATSIPYTAGTSYHLVITVDVAAQTYDATVNGIPLATAYAFRRGTSAIGQMNVWHATGGLSVSNLTTSGALAGVDTDCGGSGGAGGTGAGGGAPGGQGGVDTGPAGGAGASPGPVPGASDDDSGCSCRLGARPAQVTALGWGLGALGLAWRRRPRRATRARA